MLWQKQVGKHQRAAERAERVEEEEQAARYRASVARLKRQQGQE